MAPEGSDALRQGALIDGRYALDALLGEGSFGAVWRAHDARLASRPVAVKLLKREFVEQESAVRRFDAEADALARISHPNIVGVLDRGQWEGLRYIVMEFVEGRGLSGWLTDQRAASAPPSIATVLALFDQLCAGLEAAHGVRVPGPIVHRDLKPDNILLRSTSRGELTVKVADFGIAQLGRRTGTRSGVTMGTPLYTDVRLYGEAGIPGVIYGAGPRTVLESHAKRADERLDLEDLRRATKVVARTLKDLLLAP